MKRSSTRTAAFTLVELLTVVSIIALLMGILLPSLARARDQAKRVKAQSQLEAIGKGLELFRNEHRDEYPKSKPGPDPVTDDASMPSISGTNAMQGAHWLARALVGYDLRGNDYDFHMLDGCAAAQANLCKYNSYLKNAPPTGPQRRGTYLDLDAAKIVRDNDTAGGPSSAYPYANARFVVLDEYGFPILYYKANPSGNGIGDNPVNDGTAGPRVYYQNDNERITGSANVSDGWQLKGSPHLLKDFGNNPGDPNTFLHYFTNQEAYQASGGASGGYVKPYNAETFILISAGKDGIYGTSDDVKNFKVGL